MVLRLMFISHTSFYKVDIKLKSDDVLKLYIYKKHTYNVCGWSSSKKDVKLHSQAISGNGLK